jgi:hypothetical protein
VYKITHGGNPQQDTGIVRPQLHVANELENVVGWERGRVRSAAASARGQ